MIRALRNHWWLLAFCGILEGMCAAMTLIMLDPNGSLALRRFALPGAVWDMSLLALIAGACAIAAGLWAPRKPGAWLLSLHGLALSAYGLIGVSPLIKGPLSFRPISLLFVVMAVSAGAFAWKIAPRRLGLSAVVSVGFALSFVVVGFGRLRLAPSYYWIWMASYFGFSAILLLWLALRARPNHPVPDAL